jgi:hypothetical protein
LPTFSNVNNVKPDTSEPGYWKKRLRSLAYGSMIVFGKHHPVSEQD